MVSRIFDILFSVKKTGHITEATLPESVSRIVNEVTTGHVNPVEAYVVLDHLKKVIEKSQESLKQPTLDYIKNEGESSAFNVQLTLSAKKTYNYEEDKEWAFISRKMAIDKDALKVRETFLKDLVLKSIEAERKTPIGYSQATIISAAPISNI